MTIDEYLHTLARTMRVSQRSQRRILREIQEHLEDAVRQEEDTGLGRIEAERRAVARLGPVEALADRFTEVPAAPRHLRAALAFAAVCATAAAAIFAFEFDGTSGVSPTKGSEANTAHISYTVASDAANGQITFVCKSAQTRCTFSDANGKTVIISYTAPSGGLNSNGAVEITVPVNWSTTP